MYCSNLRKRHKRSKIVFYCTLYKNNINIQEMCKNCVDFIVKRNKPIKKISKKRIVVTDDTYQKVYERDKGKCKLKDSNCNGGLQLHHIIYRSEDKNLINEPSNCIMLCLYHHKLVHNNKHKWQPILKEMIKNDNEI